jgi:hypothetical protein
MPAASSGMTIPSNLTPLQRRVIRRIRFVEQWRVTASPNPSYASHSCCELLRLRLQIKSIRPARDTST